LANNRFRELPTTQGALQSGPGEADFVTNGFFAKIPIRVVPSISSGGVVTRRVMRRARRWPQQHRRGLGGFPVNSPAMAPVRPGPRTLADFPCSSVLCRRRCITLQASRRISRCPGRWPDKPNRGYCRGERPSQSCTKCESRALCAGCIRHDGQELDRERFWIRPTGWWTRPTQQSRASTYVSIYCTGLGPVDESAGQCSASPSNPLAATTTNPTVTIGGATAQFLWAGLAPGFVGLYQVNVLVPAATPSGTAVPVVVSTGGSTSNTVTIAVK